MEINIKQVILNKIKDIERVSYCVGNAPDDFEVGKCLVEQLALIKELQEIIEILNFE